MRKKEIIALLTEAGIEHNPKATNAELLELLPKSTNLKVSPKSTHIAYKAINIAINVILPVGESPEDERLLPCFEGSEDECQEFLNTH